MRLIAAARRNPRPPPPTDPVLHMARGKDGWIQFDKSLPKDVRIIAMARELRDRANGATTYPKEWYIATCVGAVGILWITADSSVTQNDVLALGPRDIDELTGIQGFCDLVPREWLVVLDAKSVKLPGYQAHRSSDSKRRAQGAVRQQRYRNRLLSRVRNE